MNTICISETDYQQSLQASLDAPKSPWQLTAIAYTRPHHELTLSFEQGVKLCVPVSLIPLLAKAKQKDLTAVTLSPSGEIILFDSIDIHLSSRSVIEAALLVMPEGIFASQFGARGGARSSAAKKKSSAENGKKGGRPKKKVTIPQEALVAKE